MDSPTIICAAETNKEQVKGVLKLGFANDALLRWVFPDAKAYLESFDHWMEEFSIAAFKNNICFAEDSYAGASIWHPPGEVFDESVLEPTFANIPEERLGAVAHFFEQFETYHPEDAWYLAFIAVDPAKQGQGIGSFLLKEALKMIDEKGDRAYLEASNERNKALYERYGFEMIGKVQTEDSPPAFPMIRETSK
jgi:ribosomal protein S18 acetylase RimI-like enzyme